MLNVWFNSPIKPFGPGIFFVRRCLSTNLIYLLDTYIYFFLNKFVSFEGFSHFMEVVRFMGIKLFIILPYYPFKIGRIYKNITSALWLLILVVFSNSLAILSIFSKFHLIIFPPLFFIISTSLISVQISLVSIILLTLGSICFDVSSFLK